MYVCIYDGGELMATRQFHVRLYLRLAVRKLIESFVGLHVEHHSALGALEACFVPRLQLKMEMELIKSIDSDLIAA